MKGSIKKRYGGSFSLIYDIGYKADPVTGKRKRQLKWETFRPAPGTKPREARKQAEAELRKRISERDNGTSVEPSKMTVAEFLCEWLAKSIKPLRAPETHRVYAGFIRNHIAKSSLGNVLLQKLRGSDIERYYAERSAAGLSAESVIVHGAMLSGALKKATKERLIARNPMTDVDAKPKHQVDHDDAKRHCWSAHDAAKFLTAAKKTASAQVAAFFALALDSGARKSELLGLLWTDVDLEAGQLRIERQLRVPGAKPEFGPTKTKRGRTVALGAETVALLRTHRRTQNELKLRNRATYQDHGLLFAREHRGTGGELGDALQSPLVTHAPFRQLTKEADIPAIKFHGLRHTSATLLLRAGVPPHVVARRLGHAQVTTTLETYAHVLPDMSADAAAKLAAVLHG